MTFTFCVFITFKKIFFEILFFWNSLNIQSEYLPEKWIGPCFHLFYLTNHLCLYVCSFCHLATASKLSCLTAVLSSPGVWNASFILFLHSVRGPVLCLVHCTDPLFLETFIRRFHYCSFYHFLLSCALISGFILLLFLNSSSVLNILLIIFLAVLNVCFSTYR